MPIPKPIRRGDAISAADLNRAWDAQRRKLKGAHPIAVRHLADESVIEFTGHLRTGTKALRGGFIWKVDSYADFATDAAAATEGDLGYTYDTEIHYQLNGTGWQRISHTDDEP